MGEIALSYDNDYKGIVRYLKVSNPLENTYDFIRLARKGITKSSLLFLANKIGFNLKEIATVTHVSERTLQRYASNKILDSDISDRAIQLAKLYTKGETVFESLELFKKWMKHPSVAFGNKPPLELLDTSFGFQLLSDELVRIEHGIFA